MKHRIIFLLSFVSLIQPLHAQDAISAAQLRNQLYLEYYEPCPFELVKHNLYKKDGELYFLAAMPATTKSGEVYFKTIFRKRFFFFNPDYPLADKLVDVIDPDSWERLNASFYRDKNHLYCNRMMAEGGFLMPYYDSRPKKFKFLTEKGWMTLDQIRILLSGNKNSYYDLLLEPDFSNGLMGEDDIAIGDDNGYSRYTSDGKHLFYNCAIVEGADLDSISMVPGQGGFMVKDKNHYYSGSQIVEKAE